MKLKHLKHIINHTNNLVTVVNKDQEEQITATLGKIVGLIEYNKIGDIDVLSIEVFDDAIVVTLMI